MIIDFGFAQKIPPEQMTVIRNAYLTRQYATILEILYTTPRLDGRNLSFNPRGYKYILGNFDVGFNGRIDDTMNPDLLNSKIDTLVQASRKKADDNIDAFNHHAAARHFPLLPLSNAARNHLYQGMIGGKRMRLRAKSGSTAKTTRKRKRVRARMTPCRVRQSMKI